jgi:hypothetical protein
MKIFLKLLIWSAVFETLLFLPIVFNVPFLMNVVFYPQIVPISIASNLWTDVADSPVGIFIVSWIFWFAILTAGFASTCIFQRIKQKPNVILAESPVMANDNNKNFSLRPKMSFFDMLAWFSFVAPFVAAGLTFGLGLIANNSRQNSLDYFITDFLGCEFLALVVTFIFGVVSLFGVQRHRRKLSLWIALAGILISGFSAFMAFIMCAMSGMGRNC